MSLLLDARGNEYQGTLDQITNGAITDARTIAATLSSNGAEVVMDLNGKAVACFDVRTGAASLTLEFQGTVDGTNYVTLPGINVATEAVLAAIVITTTHAATYMVGCTGFRRVRIRVTAYTSGGVTVASRATESDFSIYAKPYPSSLHITATAAVNTGSTATLPAAGVGLYHYITRVELVKLYSVIGIAAGAGVIITSSNLPGSPAWTTEQVVGAAGSCVRVIAWEYGNPLKSLVANTATTFIAGAQLQTIWRWNISYYVGA